MEYSFILLDGWAFWVVIAYLIFQFIAFLIVGNSWLSARQEIDEKKKQLRELRHGYNDLLGKYQQAMFELPEVDTNLGGKENGG